MAARDRAPLGVLGMEPLFRERGKWTGRRRSHQPLKEKESGRWLELVQRVDKAVSGVASTVHVMDREADAYELLAGSAREAPVR